MQQVVLELHRMKRSFPSVVVGAFVAALFSGQAAFAQESVGGRIASIIGEVAGPVLILTAALSYLLGIFIFGHGLAKLVEYSNGGGRVSPMAGLVRIAVAACLIALPEVAGIGMSSIGGGKNFFGQSNMGPIEASIDDAGINSAASAGVSSQLQGMTSFTAPTSCLSAEDPVPCMAGNLAKNVVPVGIFGAFIFAFLCGFFVFASQLNALAKSVGEGQGTPPGWGAKFLGSILLLNAPWLLSSVTTTIFGSGAGSVVDTFDGTLNAGGSMLTYSTGMTSGVLARYEELIGYVFVILALFGVIAFIRGVMTVMAAGEGKNQATFSHGAIYITAGVVMTNTKYFTCILMYTLGWSAYSGLGFCG